MSESEPAVLTNPLWEEIRKQQEVFSGVFVCFVPARHVVVARREAGR